MTPLARLAKGLPNIHNDFGLSLLVFGGLAAGGAAINAMDKAKQARREAQRYAAMQKENERRRTAVEQLYYGNIQRRGQLFGGGFARNRGGRPPLGGNKTPLGG